MKNSGYFERLMTRLNTDEAERGRSRQLWELLVRAVGLQGKESEMGQVHRLEDAVALQVVVLRMMKVLGDEPLFKPSEKDSARVYAHPVVDSLAKTQERLQKTMKEQLERMDAEAGGEEQGWAEIMAPILKKAEGVLEDALEPKDSEEGTRMEGNGRGRDHGMDGPL